jgi:hypothetical protein
MVFSLLRSTFSRRLLGQRICDTVEDTARQFASLALFLQSQSGKDYPLANENLDFLLVQGRTILSAIMFSSFSFHTQSRRCTCNSFVRLYCTKDVSFLPKRTLQIYKSNTFAEISSTIFELLKKKTKCGPHHGKYSS